jgi:hypothetical protein
MEEEDAARLFYLELNGYANSATAKYKLDIKGESIA